MKARLKLNLFCSICYNKIFSGKEILLEKCKKIGRFFELDFRALPRSGAFTSRYIYNLSCTTSIFCLSSLKLSNVYLYPFWRTDLDKMTYPKISKSAIFQTGSDVSKIWLDNFLPCPIPTYPENFMKIRPRVWEKTSKKKKKN